MGVAAVTELVVVNDEVIGVKVRGKLIIDAKDINSASSWVKLLKELDLIHKETIMPTAIESIESLIVFLKDAQIQIKEGNYVGAKGYLINAEEAFEKAKQTVASEQQREIDKENLMRRGLT